VNALGCKVKIVLNDLNTKFVGTFSGCPPHSKKSFGCVHMYESWYEVNVITNSIRLDHGTLTHKWAEVSTPEVNK
jgi:hypothetical protein